MRNVRIVGVLAVLALLVTASGCDSSPKPRGEKITLQLNLEKGDTKRLTYDIDMDISGKEKGKRMEMKMQMGLEMGVQVDDVAEDGVHTLTMTYDRLKMKMSGGPMSLDYDSKKPGGSGNPATEIFEAMLGQSLTLKVKPDGTTVELSGVDELADKMAGSLPPGAGPQARQQLESMKQSFDQMMATYPKCSVSTQMAQSGG